MALQQPETCIFSISISIYSNFGQTPIQKDLGLRPGCAIIEKNICPPCNGLQLVVTFVANQISAVETLISEPYGCPTDPSKAEYHETMEMCLQFRS